MKRILIVDDETDVVKVIKFRLMKAGYEILTAADGKIGLDSVYANKPDLILLDFSMPSMEGDEVCKHLKADPKTSHIPVILMTASAKRVEEEYIQLIRADDRILKPFEPEELLAKIKKLLTLERDQNE